MSIYKRLKALTGCIAASGNEKSIHEAIRKELEGCGLEFSCDVLGNLIAKKPADGEKSIMFSAHADRIGFMVTHIEDCGLIRAAALGGINYTAFAYTPMLFENGACGVLVPEKDAASKDMKASDFFCDIGAKSKREAENKVSVGETFSCELPLKKLSSSLVTMPALDNRVGCAGLIEAAHAIKDTRLPYSVYFVFSSQEELGQRGVGAAAFSISPSAAINIDVTPSGDIPSVKGTVKLSSGPAIKIKDKSVFCTENVKNHIIALAKREKIAIQTEVGDSISSDTAAIIKSSSGVSSGAISVPIRYNHTPCEIIDIKDAEAAAKLISICALNATEIL